MTKKRNIVLLVGDGLTKDFVGNSLDTSKPLTYFSNQKMRPYYNFFMPYVLETHNDILKLYSEKQLKHEFDAIELYSEINKDNIPKECQLRRYLALTYSSLQRELDKHSKINWRWSKWIDDNKNNIKFAISFNYDLLLESTLKVNNIDYYRVGSNETESGIPVIKPHGSIDFDIQQPQFNTFLKQLEISKFISSSYFSLNQVGGIIQAIPSCNQRC